MQDWGDKEKSKTASCEIETCSRLSAEVSLHGGISTLFKASLALLMLWAFNLLFPILFGIGLDYVNSLAAQNHTRRKGIVATGSMRLDRKSGKANKWKRQIYYISDKKADYCWRNINSEPSKIVLHFGDFGVDDEWSGRSVWRSNHGHYRRFPPISPCLQPQWCIIRGEGRRPQDSADRKRDIQTIRRCLFWISKNGWPMQMAKHTEQAADGTMRPQRHGRNAKTRLDRIKPDFQVTPWSDAIPSLVTSRYAIREGWNEHPVVKHCKKKKEESRTYVMLTRRTRNHLWKKD